jgi:WhiB family transcriptional regulator, redox-sensing transcriptional regulator
MADIRRLPVPVTDVWDWQMRGACRGMRSSVFFLPGRERGPARAAREELAKKVCRSCPVLEECRAHALAVREPYGVWGGLSAAERAELVRAHADRQVVVAVDFTGQRHGSSPAPDDGPRPA